ncbi:MAG: YhcH/YjgK/YiaL family protein [Dysgonamonadaceae bacterium]|jgi:YhcH/YjgK/YiaL family protein|nr:YhcH/YjgK/YiaL family protein [Dysgonamonadaceae bacterium]
MILDLLKNTTRYELLNPRFKQAFDFLKTADLTALPLGKMELDGKNLYVNVQEVEGKTPEIARMETHDDYIDIQIPLSATETMGWMSRENLKQLTEAYNAEKDITFYADKTENLIRVQPGEFAVFFPEDGHQPCIAQGKIKKIIVKVRI